MFCATLHADNTRADLQKALAAYERKPSNARERRAAQSTYWRPRFRNCPKLSEIPISEFPKTPVFLQRICNFGIFGFRNCPKLEPQGAPTNLSGTNFWNQGCASTAQDTHCLGLEQALCNEVALQLGTLTQLRVLGGRALSLDLVERIAFKRPNRAQRVHCQRRRQFA